jgi:hypothetical protein
VYALLDSQSDTSFIAEEILNEFSLPSQDVKGTNLSLTTLHRQATVHCMKAHGFRIHTVGSEEDEVFLPPLYSRSEIPFTYEHVPDPELVKSWPHLESIAECIPAKDSAVRIGLLIGFDCSFVHFPKSVVAGGPGDPYAVESPVGWYVVGRLWPLSPEDTPENQLLTHTALRTRTKEIPPHDIRKMLEVDFQERQVEDKMSLEDLRFLRMVKQAHMQDGHMVIPLPLKNPECQMPNNKAMALKRLSGLKKKLLKDSVYHAEYTAFMEKIIANGQAERSPPVEEEGRTWYIPHHGIQLSSSEKETTRCV